jgi:hypothetical protein
VLHLDARGLADPVDAVEPTLHAGKTPRCGPAPPAPAASAAFRALSRGAHHVHVGQHTVRQIFQREGAAVRPERARVDAKTGRKSNSCMSLGESVCQIVDERDDRRRLHGAPFTGRQKRGPENAGRFNGTAPVRYERPFAETRSRRYAGNDGQRVRCRSGHTILRAQSRSHAAARQLCVRSFAALGAGVSPSGAALAEMPCHRRERVVGIKPLLQRGVAMPSCSASESPIALLNFLTALRSRAEVAVTDTVEPASLYRRSCRF